MLVYVFVNDFLTTVNELDQLLPLLHQTSSQPSIQQSLIELPLSVNPYSDAALISPRIIGEITSLNLRTLNSDQSFPDLFLSGFPDTLDPAYLDYLEKKIRRLGYDPDEFAAVNPNIRALPTLSEERTPDFSNQIIHKGKVWDIPKLADDEKFKLLGDLGYDQLQKYNNLECVRSQNYISTPSRKLHYPEPFIASASFVHTDIGFIHILHYQYWLWVFFIFLIVFFFLTYLCTIRWCNMRVRPRRETRGVSRSKCGDLITACVPVSWAVTIIVTESTDASDLYDGFGAAELTVGIRAYQWGWEYYYPKNLDLNYNIKSSYTSYTGKSLKYNLTTESTLAQNDLWRFYQNKTTDASLTPSHLLLLPLDNTRLLNFMNFNDIGQNSLKEASAFKKIRTTSKTYTTNLVVADASTSSRFKKLHDLYKTDNSFLSSTNYSFLRQHNLLNTKALGGALKTGLDNSSFKKFLEFNNLQQLDKVGTGNFHKSINFLENLPNQGINTSLTSSLLNDSGSLLSPQKLFTQYTNLSATINNDSDKTLYHYPLRKLLNNSLFGTKFSNLVDLKPNLLPNFESAVNVTSTKKAKTLNTFDSASIKTRIYQAPNQVILPSDQNIRQYPNLTPTTTNFNFSQPFFDPKSFGSETYDVYTAAKTSWANTDLLLPLLSNKTYLEAPFSPIFSNQTTVDSLNYDTSTTRSQTNLPLNSKLGVINQTKPSNDIHILRGKRDGAPTFLSTSYWKFFWANSSPLLRLNSLSTSLNAQTLNYFPTFTNYYDYDFRNIQAYELLEDLFWETTHSSYSHFDYLTFNSNTEEAGSTGLRTSMREPYFYLENNNPDFKLKSLKKLPNITSANDSTHYSNTLVLDDFSTPSQLTNTHQSQFTVLINNLFNLDDSYEAWNDNRFTTDLTSQPTLNSSTPDLSVASYLGILNTFRADFDDFSWSQNKDQGAVKPWTLDMDLLQYVYDLEAKEFRLTNPLTLRSTARNSIVTYNALQKVFRARFEDGRSHASLNQFSALNVEQPFLNTSRVPYESLLGKTRNNFYKVNFYNNDSLELFNNLYSSSGVTNYQFFDFPFLLSAKSDMSRYMWFDWYAKWGLVEAQSSSVSRYSTLGVPYIRKPFDYNVETSDPISETETYLTRISRARKNYLPNWTYTSYIFARSNTWTSANLGSLVSSPEYSTLRFILAKAANYTSAPVFADNTSDVFTPSNSGISTYTKSSWRPFSSVQSYYYTLSTLGDFLTKRELLLRQYLELNNRVIHLPADLRSTPNNPLVSEIQASFNFNDSTILNTEYSREVYYSSLEVFKFLLIREWLLLAKNPVINLTALNDYLFFYIFGIKNFTKNSDAIELYKNPYRPLRKGISSMLRLHSTGAVAMPIEVRLQVLASSRDVIHSWSVPSAGVKIDCVPGYTSHKIMIFLMEGIYWGQCMEICGRYHHWMPIVVYFMRRDLFFLWCTHFIFNSNLTTVWDINDRQYSDYIRYISFDKATWLNEFVA